MKKKLDIIERSRGRSKERPSRSNRTRIVKRVTSEQMLAKLKAKGRK